MDEELRRELQAQALGCPTVTDTLPDEFEALVAVCVDRYPQLNEVYLRSLLLELLGGPLNPLAEVFDQISYAIARKRADWAVSRHE